MKLDSHQHFWFHNETDYPWMGPEHVRIKRDFLPADLKPLLEANGIDGCVAVQARQTTKETEWLLALADQNEWIRGVVGWVPLTGNAGEPWLERIGPHAKLAGVRHVIHDETDDKFILRDDFNAGIRCLAAYGLVYDILIFTKHLPQTVAFVDRHPGQPFVVDHIAKPRIRGSSFDEVWAAGIRELALRENICCKISGMVTEVGDEPWNQQLLRPYFETVFDAFGAQRVMFGSDWPVCLLRSDYKSWIRAAEAFTATLSPDEQTAFWGGNAVRMYGLEPIPAV